jgi:uracil phosphoribosyltransferase
LEQQGAVRSLHIAAAIAAPEGVRFIQQQLGEDVNLWIGAIDDHLNADDYIVPGLGDAGDLSFGDKR